MGHLGTSLSQGTQPPNTDGCLCPVSTRCWLTLKYRWLYDEGMDSIAHLQHQTCEREGVLCCSLFLSVTSSYLAVIASISECCLKSAENWVLRETLRVLRCNTQFRVLSDDSHIFHVVVVFGSCGRFLSCFSVMVTMHSRCSLETTSMDRFGWRAHRDGSGR